MASGNLRVCSLHVILYVDITFRDILYSTEENNT